MALRVYHDSEGAEWRVWRVIPESISFATLDESYRHGWLCFERVDGGERRRLSMTKVPDGWDELPDERLDLLRRGADVAQRSPLTAGRSEESEVTETSPRGEAPLGDDDPTQISRKADR